MIATTTAPDRWPKRKAPHTPEKEGPASVRDQYRRILRAYRAKLAAALRDTSLARHRRITRVIILRLAIAETERLMREAPESRASDWGVDQHCTTVIVARA